MKVRKQASKTLATVLAACMLTSGMATGVSAYYDDESFVPSEHTLGVVGSFTEWGEYSDVVMRDDDGDGIYVATVDLSDYGYDDGDYSDFKVRADEYWDYNWGVYEEDYDRTFNSQTNFSITIGEEGTVFYVYLDTTGDDMYVWDCGWTYDPSEIGIIDPEIKTTEDGFRYRKIDNTEVNVIGYTGTGTDIVIPDTIEDLPVTKLKQGLFRNNGSIKKVKLPANLKSIPDNMFNGCTSLEEVTVPSGLTDIGSYAFYKCTNLTAIDLPDTVTVMDSYCFACSGLKSFKVPQGVTSITSGSFYECNSLAAVTFSQGLKSIGYRAFSECEALTEAIIPDSVDSIGESAFNSCKSLKNVKLPSALTGIEECTFYGTAIEGIVIPDNVEYISYGGFSYCESLKTVELGAEISSVSSSAFYNCSSFEGFTVSDENSYYSAMDGVLFNKAKTNLIIYPTAKTAESYTVPNTVTTIQSNAFSNSKLQKISMPASVTEINSYAFSNSGLTSITLPSSVTYLGEGAFSNCKSLGTAKLGKNIKTVPENCFYECKSLSSITFGSNTKTIGEYAFYNCDALNSVAFPEGVTTIGYEAFYDCDVLEAVTFPSTLTSIGYEAFSNCDKLAKVVLPEALVTVNDEAFAYCYSLKSVSVNSDVNFGYSVFYEDPLEEISLGKNVTKIDLGNLSVNNNTAIVIDPENPNFIIEDNILYNTDKTQIFSALPAFSITDYTVPSTVTTINDRAFYGKAIVTLTVPESVKTVGSGAFGNCNSLRTVALNAKLTALNSSVFYNCNSLQEITIPDTVTEIGDYAFCNCNSLKKAIIPDSVKTIGYEAFESCGGLETVIIGKSVESIGSEAFEYCYDLRAIVIPSKVTSIGYDAFNGDGNLVIYGEAGSYAESYAINNRKNFEEYAELENFSFVYESAIDLGASVNIRCLADGGIGRYKFECAVKQEGSSRYTVIQEFGSNKKIVYKPASAGKYTVRVRVRDDIGTIAAKTTSFEVKSSALNNLSSIGVTEAAVNERVLISAAASGGTEPYTFAYYFKRSTNTKWNKIGTEFGTADSAVFTPTAAADYDIKVIVKDANGATSEKLFGLTVKDGIINDSYVNAEKVQIGDDIRVTGAAKGGTGSYKYAFYFKRSTNSKWNKIGTEFGTATYGIAVPKAAADYDMKVIVKDSAGNTAEKIFKVTVVESLPVTNTSYLSADTVEVGKTVTVAGRFVGGTKPCTFEYYFKRSANIKWNTLKSANEKGTYAKFTPTTAAEYDIKVIAVDSKGAKSEKVMKLSVNS